MTPWFCRSEELLDEGDDSLGRLLERIQDVDYGLGGLIGLSDQEEQQQTHAGKGEDLLEVHGEMLPILNVSVLTEVLYHEAL